jgi:hypothetical protein
VCAGGSFAGDSPLGCSGTALNTVAFAIDGDALLSSSVDLPIASFFDIFADITLSQLHGRWIYRHSDGYADHVRRSAY